MAPAVYGAGEGRALGNPGNQFYFFQVFRNFGGQFFNPGTMQAEIANGIGVKAMTSIMGELKASQPGIQKLDAEGRIRSRDWRRYDLQHLVYELPGWSPERLESAVRDVEARFYGWRAFVRRTAKLRRYPRLLRPATLFLYLVVSLQYAATFRRRRLGPATVRP